MKKLGIGERYIMLVQGLTTGTLKPIRFGEATADYSLFADDMGVYLELQETSFRALRGILSFFESASGAKLNLHKSSALIIGKHTPAPDWLQRTGCEIMEHKKPYRYLGAPIGSGLTQDQLISFCINRMTSRLNLWSNRILSFEGRVILTKHILLTIPIFFISTIGINKKAAVTIEQVARQFLWGKTEQGNYWRSLTAWKELQKGKRFGGLGFKDIWRQSTALLAKHMGDFMTNHLEAQWHQLLRAYITNQRAKRSNLIIRNQYEPQEILMLRRKIYPGKSYIANALISSWNKSTQGLHWSPVQAHIPAHITLRDLVILTMHKDTLSNAQINVIMQDLRKRGVTTSQQLWDKRQRLLSTFRDHLGTHSINLVRRILRSKGPATRTIHSAQGWKWDAKTHVNSLTKSAAELYKVIKTKEDWTRDLNAKWRSKDKGTTWNRRWKLIWHPQIPPKDSIFVWRMLRQALYTAERAQRLGHGNGECPICKQARENVNHLFLSCSALKQFWQIMYRDKLLPLGLSTSIFQLSLPKFIDEVLGPVPGSIARWKVLIEIWRQLWLIRNLHVFERRKKETTVWLCTRQALDKCIIRWRDERGPNKNEETLLIALELLNKIPEGRWTELHKKLQEELRDYAATQTPPSEDSGAQDENQETQPSSTEEGSDVADISSADSKISSNSTEENAEIQSQD
ncbi:hypothetical protein R1sor_023017 [Riccia sorocarpa]|uniref:Reverse transcriptase zinc-binding domain-containing protein n=1 Tax=Riccia sorocarpa TaxID=122646 RepID=A0ABD3GN16_9MARC